MHYLFNDAVNSSVDTATKGRVIGWWTGKDAEGTWSRLILSQYPYIPKKIPKKITTIHF